ncbi:D-3-phosphoglycerate dehydrogenase [Papilio xuthus]|uniref:D-3-phosphoglycerate dehydrogenase n=1 Tax=Papilio xuthus TaxID=66420 RepID=A0A194PEZ1_PAPXU|nr:D-3-phosphoglycerate dehydrogenase [Papilio xuthus]
MVTLLNVDVCDCDNLRTNQPNRSIQLVHRRPSPEDQRANNRLFQAEMALNIGSVLILDGVGQNCEEILAQNGIYSTNMVKITEEELLRTVSVYDALVVRSATQVTKEVLDAGKEFKVVARAGAGVDNIDVAAAADKGICVINAPGANAVSACELTCGLIMSITRRIVPAVTALREGRWERSLCTGTEVNDRTLAIIGLGRVGREVGMRMHAFGMKIIGYDPFVSMQQCESFHCTKMELDEIWPLADYITLHTPLIESTRSKYHINNITFITIVLIKAKSWIQITYSISLIIGYDPFVSMQQCESFHCTKMELDEIWPLADYITLHTPLIESTRNFINADVFKRCKKGVKIINVARGGLINEQDLLDALNSGQVSGAAIDVFEQEPPTDPLTWEIIRHPAVLATPHLGASTKEAQSRVGQEIAEQLVNLAKPGTYSTPLAEVTNIFKK